MPGFRAFGIFFVSMMLINWIGNGFMPRILMSVARTGGVVSRGSQSLFHRVGR